MSRFQPAFVQQLFETIAYTKVLAKIKVTQYTRKHGIKIDVMSFQHPTIYAIFSNIITLEFNGHTLQQTQK